MVQVLPMGAVRVLRAAPLSFVGAAFDASTFDSDYGA
jgi:hypothetical protein